LVVRNYERFLISAQSTHFSSFWIAAALRLCLIYFEHISAATKQVVLRLRQSAQLGIISAG
jgi:hypothetical protein